MNALQSHEWPKLFVGNEEVTPDEYNQQRIAKGLKSINPPRIKRRQKSVNALIDAAKAAELQARKALFNRFDGSGYVDMTKHIDTSRLSTLHKAIEDANQLYRSLFDASVALESELVHVHNECSDEMDACECLWTPQVEYDWCEAMAHLIYKVEQLTNRRFVRNMDGAQKAMDALRSKIEHLNAEKVEAKRELDGRNALFHQLIDASQERAIHNLALANIERARKGKSPLQLNNHLFSRG